jgi:hypothetical protein
VWLLVLKFGFVGRAIAPVIGSPVRVFFQDKWHSATTGSQVPAGTRFHFYEDHSTVVFGPDELRENVKCIAKAGEKLKAEELHHAAVYLAGAEVIGLEGSGILKDNQEDCEPLLINKEDKRSNKNAVQALQQLWPKPDWTQITNVFEIKKKCVVRA